MKEIICLNSISIIGELLTKMDTCYYLLYNYKVNGIYSFMIMAFVFVIKDHEHYIEK